jgi:DNA-binding NarL/FixJ family response regulator
MPALASNQTETALVRVVVIEDQRELREGLKILLDFTPNFCCIKCFSSMEDALDGLEADTGDLILTDIGLPRMDGIEGTRILRRKFPALPIIVLTVHGEDDKIFQALCAGASGYLLKNTAPARIVEAIREVLDGGAPMSPDVARRVVHLFRTFTPPAEVEYHLTEQERRILKMLVEGHHYKTAAYELGISKSTISFHLKNVYEKLQVHSKTEAVAKALREKII